MFPSGWPGAGLLLLRASIGATAIVQGARCLLDPAGVSLLLGIASVLAIISGICTLIGFVTPLVGFILGLGATSLAIFGARAELSSLFAVAMAAAICCLGPGAFSVDALLFGRREIIIPRSRQHS
jgi:hypothetical protein